MNQEVCVKEPTQGGILLIETALLIGQAPQKRSKNRNEILREAELMRKYGPTTPLTVTPTGEYGPLTRYYIEIGEEIWQAACLAGVERLPCMILPSTPQNRQKEIYLAQIRQKTGNFFEKARLMQMLLRDFSMTQEELATRTGLSQSAVANKLRLLRLLPKEQQTILQFALGERHARALLRLPNGKEREDCLKIIAQKRLSVADTEALVEEMLRHRKHSSGASEASDAPLEPKNTAFQPISSAEPPIVAPDRKCGSNGEYRPRRFALQSLQPLYNSIQRTLTIFRKTGRTADFAAEEGEWGTRITITIPKEG